MFFLFQKYTRASTGTIHTDGLVDVMSPMQPKKYLPIHVVCGLGWSTNNMTIRECVTVTQ